MNLKSIERFGLNYHLNIDMFLSLPFFDMQLFKSDEKRTILQFNQSRNSQNSQF